MTEFTSQIRTIPHNDEPIFSMLSDLSNLERVKARIPEDKIKRFSFSNDRCCIEVDPVGKVEFQIVDREPNKTIKFETIQSPVPLSMWIQLKQVAEKDTKMKMTVRAKLNPFIKAMVSKVMQEVVDKISEVIASLPYESSDNKNT